MRDGKIDFSDARRISEAHFREWTKKARPQTHDVVLSRRTNPGVTATFGDRCDFALGQNLVLLRADGRRVRPAFLRWLVRSPAWWQQIDKFLNVGAVFDSLRCADVPRFELPIPTLAEQAKIGTVLDALDDKIELNRRMIETLEAMARAIFQDWFVTFGPTRAKMEGRPPYLAPDLWSLFPDRLDAEGKPEGWATCRVEELLELVYGKSLPATVRTEGPFPVYGSGGVTGFHATAITQPPCIIVGRKGTVGSLFWDDRPCFPIDTVFYVLPKAPMTFCFYLLKSLGLETMNTDAAVPGLNRSNVYRLTGTWGTPDLRLAFDQLVTVKRQKIFANEEENRTLAATRDLLLPRLMTGELRVKDAELGVGDAA
ncbi:MAG: restriction endonuclease subunit S [Roseomonas sp.]|nr:restriction endonuclease subunit S [Roseomonas sp.]